MSRLEKRDQGDSLKVDYQRGNVWRCLSKCVKERAYPKHVAHEGDAQRYGELNFRIDAIIITAEMRRAATKQR